MLINRKEYENEKHGKLKARTKGLNVFGRLVKLRTFFLKLFSRHNHAMLVILISQYLNS